MEILNPAAFLLIVFIPLFLRKKSINSKIVIHSAKNYFFLIAYIFLIIALSRPVINNGYINVKLPKTNIITAIDISTPMKKKDFYPDNLKFTINKFSKFVHYLDYENISVMLFAKDVYLLSPLSDDYSSITYLLKHIPIFQTPVYPSFINLVKKANEFKNPKVLLIFTNNTASKKAIDFAKEHNLKVFIYMLSKTPNKIMEDFAKMTNGGIVYANYSNSDIKNLADMINSINKKREVKIKDRKELFYYFLFIAIVFIFLGIFKGRKWD